MKRLNKSLSKSLLIAPIQYTSSLKMLLGITLVIFCNHSSYTGVTQGDHYVIGEKHIAVFGDNHEAGNPEAQTVSVENFVEVLKETSPAQWSPYYSLGKRCTICKRSKSHNAKRNQTYSSAFRH